MLLSLCISAACTKFTSFSLGAAVEVRTQNVCQEIEGKRKEGGALLKSEVWFGSPGLNFSSLFRRNWNTSMQGNAESCNKFSGGLTSVGHSHVCIVQGCRKGSGLCQLRAQASRCIPGTERQALLLCTSFPLFKEAVAVSRCMPVGTGAIQTSNCRQLEKFAFFLMQLFLLL